MDIDLKKLSIRVRNGKGNEDEIVFITSECANTLQKYFKVRPNLIIKGKHYVFYTDYGRPCNREAPHRMFILTKKRAGIDMPGAVHFLSVTLQLQS